MRSALRICLFWITLGLVNATQIVAGMRAEGMRHNWTALFFASSVSWLIWACATPLVLGLGRKYSPMAAPGWRGWSIHLGTCLGIGMADSCWNAALASALNPLALRNPPPFRILAIEQFYSRFHIELITYGAIVAVGYTVDSLRRLAMREAELSKAQLDALRRQIEPHFLFNTLNGIAGLVRDHQNRAAVGMIAGLSDLLRRVLEDSERQLVPLAEEISFLERYLELQRMRFGDRLKVIIDVPGELCGAMVPSLILQPLVENAILHGIEQRVDGGSIRISAAGEDQVLILQVHNDGPGLPAFGVASAGGVGITNTLGRLRTLYGMASALEVRNHALAGVETVLRLPYRTGA